MEDQLDLQHGISDGTGSSGKGATGEARITDTVGIGSLAGSGDGNSLYAG